MAKNELTIRRTAFGNFTLAASDNTANHSSNVLSLKGGQNAYIPAGAIITGIKYWVGGAITNGSNFKNGTINVFAGAVALGTNNVLASQALLQTAVAAHAIAASQGVVVPLGGQLIVAVASSDNARTGIVLDADVYVEYLYCADKDTA